MANLFQFKKHQSYLRFSFLLRAFKLVWQAGPVSAVVLLVLNALIAFSPAVNLYLTKLMIDRIAGLIMKTDTNKGELYCLIAILIGMWLLMHFIEIINNSVIRILQFKIDQNAQMAIIHKCAEMDMAFFEDPTNYNMLENASLGAGSQIYSVMASFFSVVQSLITLGTFITILIGFHWIVLLIIMVISIPQLIANNYFVKKRWRIDLSLAEPRRLQNFYTAFTTHRDFLKEVRLFGLTDTFLERFRYFAGRFIGIETGFVKEQGWINGILGMIPLAGYAVIWWMIIQQGIAGRISIGDIVLYTGAVSSCHGAFDGLFSIGNQLFQNALYLENFFKLIDLDPLAIEGALHGTSAGQRSGSLQICPKLKTGIEFRNVSFAYPGAAKKVLQNLSFKLKPGESTAIVGKNGAGKTTLIKLLVRLYDPTEGEILLDGINIKEYDLKSLQQCFGAIFQDFISYPLTVRENIGFGRVEYVNDPARIQSAAAKAGAHEFIEKLSAKYETYLGRIFAESDEDLSTGQWQKISLARALMHEQALVLILDEPTAALDAFAEYEVYKMFNTLMVDRLSIIISHRFSTVKCARHILVLDGGCLVDEGTHEELVSHNSLYAEMYNMQANQYK